MASIKEIASQIEASFEAERTTLAQQVTDCIVKRCPTHERDALIARLDNLGIWSGAFKDLSDAFEKYASTGDPIYLPRLAFGPEPVVAVTKPRNPGGRPPGYSPNSTDNNFNGKKFYEPYFLRALLFFAGQTADNRSIQYKMYDIMDYEGVLLPGDSEYLTSGYRFIKVTDHTGSDYAAGGYLIKQGNIYTLTDAGRELAGRFQASALAKRDNDPDAKVAEPTVELPAIIAVRYPPQRNGVALTTVVNVTPGVSVGNTGNSGTLAGGGAGFPAAPLQPAMSVSEALKALQDAPTSGGFSENPPLENEEGND